MPNKLKLMHRRTKVKSCCDLRQERLQFIENNYPTIKTTTEYNDLIIECGKIMSNYLIKDLQATFLNPGQQYGALVAFAVPTPFMLLELLVGLIQAAVFSMLTIVYLTVASSEPHGAEEH